MSTYVFRPSLNEAGEPLLSALTPHEAVGRLMTFIDFSGLTNDDVVVAPTTTMPLPLYPAAWPEGRRRWAGVNPAALWHPVFWLPKRLAERAIVDDGDQQQVESDELWSTRVVAELTMLGAYQEETGEWLDLFALHGLSTDNQADLDRVAAWLDGADDPTLDAFGLAYPNDDQTVSVADAWEALQLLRPVQWVIAADAIVDDIDDVFAEQAAVTDEDLEAEVRRVVALTEFSLHTVPGVSPLTVDTTAPRDVLLGETLPRLRAQLAAISAQYSPMVAGFQLDDDTDEAAAEAPLDWSDTTLHWGVSPA